MEGEGVVVENSISLLVDSVSALGWNLRTNDPIAHQNYPAQLTIDVQNVGNSEINHRLDVKSDWNVIIQDELLLILSPGESRSITIEFTPDSGSDGDIEIFLRDAETIPRFFFHYRG